MAKKKSGGGYHRNRNNMRAPNGRKIKHGQSKGRTRIVELTPDDSWELPVIRDQTSRKSS